MDHASKNLLRKGKVDYCYHLRSNEKAKQSFGLHEIRTCLAPIAFFLLTSLFLSELSLHKNLLNKILDYYKFFFLQLYLLRSIIFIIVFFDISYNIYAKKMVYKSIAIEKKSKFVFD